MARGVCRYRYRHRKKRPVICRRMTLDKPLKRFLRREKGFWPRTRPWGPSAIGSKLKIKSTDESRRTYREMLFSTPVLSEFVSGVIMYDETIRQSNSKRGPLAKQLN